MSMVIAAFHCFTGSAVSGDPEGCKSQWQLHSNGTMPLSCTCSVITRCGKGLSELDW